MHLTGVRNAAVEYQRLSTSRKDAHGLRTTAMVLFALYLSDQRSVSSGAELLLGELSRGVPGLERMVLLLHLSILEAYRDNVEAAIATAEAARETSRTGIPIRFHRVLQRVAKYNIAAYRQLSGEYVAPFGLPLRATELPLLRGAVDVSIGLERFLEEQFEVATRNPWGRTVVFRREDPVEWPLRAAVMRADCLADWFEKRRARSLLARYQVVSRLGTAEGVPQEALTLLRRAGDDKNLTAAARSIAAIGPLGALRAEAVEAIESPWPRAEQTVTFALLAGSADLLHPREADRALKRLISSTGLSVGHAIAAFRAISQLTRVASDRTQASVSRYAREIARDLPAPLALQELQGVVASIRWAAVSTAERRRWLAHIQEHQMGSDYERLFADRALDALSPFETEAAAEILVKASKDSLDLPRLALAADTDVPLPRDLRQQAHAILSKQLEETRRKAAAGSYEFGGIDVGLLTLRFADSDSSGDLWDQLGDFLIDPLVGINAKLGAIEALADEARAVPTRLQKLLRAHIADVTGFADSFGASEHALQGAALRLWLRLGGTPRELLLSRLLDLAGSLEREARLQAALTLPSARRRLGPDSTITLGLTLTRDADVTVRALAGQSLAQIKTDGLGELEELVTERLVALLEEPGTEVPLRTLVGLIHARRRGQSTAKEVVAAARRLRRSHPSRRVDEAARTLLGESSRPRRSNRSP
jgi:hypothetical protein